MATKKFATYSLADVKVVINSPAKGQCVISEEGGGRIVISHSGEMASNTKTATGYVVINKMRAKDGSVSLELPQNSDADLWMRKWITFLANAPTSQFADTTMTVYDPAVNRTYTLTGVVPQKMPDENYDQTAGNRQYTLLVAEISES